MGTISNSTSSMATSMMADAMASGAGFAAPVAAAAASNPEPVEFSAEDLQQFIELGSKLEKLDLSSTTLRADDIARIAKCFPNILQPLKITSAAPRS